MDNVKKEEAVNNFNERMNEYNVNDTGTTAKEGDEKIRKLTSAIPKPLLDIWDDIKELISLLKDYAQKNYRDIPLKSIIAIGAAIAYFISPIDIIPDTLPIIGYLDDALVIKLAMDLIGDDVNEYKNWKKETKPPVESAEA